MHVVFNSPLSIEFQSRFVRVAPGRVPPAQLLGHHPSKPNYKTAVRDHQSTLCIAPDFSSRFLTRTSGLSPPPKVASSTNNYRFINLRLLPVSHLLLPSQTSSWLRLVNEKRGHYQASTQEGQVRRLPYVGQGEESFERRRQQSALRHARP